jgi:hypothetical protein
MERSVAAKAASRRVASPLKAIFGKNPRNVLGTKKPLVIVNRGDR